jgi:Flp pilus assembly protein TadB
VRGLANLYRAESPEKASAWIAGLLPPSGAALMISSAA